MRQFLNNTNRAKMFDFFKNNHINCVFYGKYEDFCKINYDKDRKVVIYNNIGDKNSENKQLVTFCDIKDEQKSLYMSEFIETQKTIYCNFISRSTHCVYENNFVYCYNEYSVNDWQSNKGNHYINKHGWFLDIPKWVREDSIVKIKFVGPDNNLKAFKVEFYEI